MTPLPDRVAAAAGTLARMDGERPARVLAEPAVIRDLARSCPFRAQETGPAELRGAGAVQGARRDELPAGHPRGQRRS